ncbi:MAG: type I-U CRISPR-associated protein Cas5/Cas6 [Nitrososphaerota archaeon]|nr:type I-U CRISPR-associated protein Cas5/Cas6 [Nitrososphaerota archaeon]MDG7037938.1 type I-U CRISPR-associated protein Cas5/Cas6 [Nitrososphaerota archaeon]
MNRPVIKTMPAQTTNEQFLAIEFQFIAGRYHTTPWKKHVNDGVPEWPPSQYRLIRALYDIWKRKRPEWPPERVEPVLRMLALEHPIYQLPRYKEACIRTFQKKPVPKTDNYRPSDLIFDPFVSVDPLDKAVMAWSLSLIQERLTQQSIMDLRELLSLMNYFGRSESWVSATLVYPLDGDKLAPNSYPSSVGTERGYRTVDVACTKPEFVREHTNWLDEITRSTYETKKANLLEFSGFLSVKYQLKIPEVIHLKKTTRQKQINEVIYMLTTSLPIPVTQTVALASRFHSYLMGSYKRTTGGKQPSPRFSGKTPDGEPLKGHVHAYILPFDEDRNGWLDHVAIRCREPFTAEEVNAIYGIDRLRFLNYKEPDVRMVPSQRSLPSSNILESVSPFVPPRHYRKGRGDYYEWVVGELIRELNNHGYPRPVKVEPLLTYSVNNGRQYQWYKFIRDHKRNGLERPGYGFKITFDHPVKAPIAVGHDAHFGLGMFMPLSRKNDYAK